MIPATRKYWILHGLFANAQTLNEVRWLNAKFASEIDVFTTEQQLRLSAVMERRVTELEGVSSAPACSGFQEGPRSVLKPFGRGSDCPVLRPEYPRGDGAAEGCPPPKAGGPNPP
jgi:hypothetical protein